MGTKAGDSDARLAEFEERLARMERLLEKLAGERPDGPDGGGRGGAATREANRGRRAGEAAESQERNGKASQLPPPEGALGVTRHRRTVRDQVLEVLDELGFLAYTREVSQYSYARYGREISPTRFGTLVSDEVRTYRNAHVHMTARATRHTWLAFALTSDRGEPIKRVLGRSDWPVEQRIWTPCTGRVQHLRMTSRLCEAAMQSAEAMHDADSMRIIAADHARGLPGVKVRRGEFELEEWRRMAQELLAEVKPEDDALKREAAERLGRRPEWAQLFGVVDTIVEVGEDGLDPLVERRR